MKWLTRSVWILVAVLVVLIFTQYVAHAAEHKSRLENKPKSEVCQAWAGNATFAAVRRAVGVPYVIKYITPTQKAQMDEAAQGLMNPYTDALYILDDDMLPDERAWTESALLAGWTKMDEYIKALGVPLSKETMPDTQNIFEFFTMVCMQTMNRT